MLDSIRSFFVKALVPSNWVEWLNGRKRVLGAIQLGLWVLIYGIPAVKPEWAFLAATGMKLQSVLLGLGVNVGGALLASGTSFTVVGLVDWLLDHGPSKVVSHVLKKAEKPLTPEPAPPK